MSWVKKDIWKDVDRERFNREKSNPSLQEPQPVTVIYRANGTWSRDETLALSRGLTNMPDVFENARFQDVIIIYGHFDDKSIVRALEDGGHSVSIKFVNKTHNGSPLLPFCPERVVISP